jgi:hypothetical protein
MHSPGWQSVRREIYGTAPVLAIEKRLCPFPRRPSRYDISMRIDLYGLAFETPRVYFHLWTPWRAMQLEHRLFEAVRQLPRTAVEQGVDGLRIPVSDPRLFRQAVQNVERVLKGWQEEADRAVERRNWCWVIEGDTNCDGYDQGGEPACLWALISTAIERGGPDSQDKNEEIDLEGFSLQIERSSSED